MAADHGQNDTSSKFLKLSVVHLERCLHISDELFTLIGRIQSHVPTCLPNRKRLLHLLQRPIGFVNEGLSVADHSIRNCTHDVAS